MDLIAVSAFETHHRRFLLAGVLAPTNPIAHLYPARQYLYLGHHEEALACLAEHERVAPLFPWQYFIAFNKGLAHFMAGCADQAARLACCNKRQPAAVAVP